jgi:gas vesicle protein
MGKNERNLALGAIVGAGVGYLAGILTAKKSGKETRQDIANATLKAKNKAEKTIKVLHTDLVAMLKEGEVLLKSTKSNAKEGFVKALENAKKARNNTREVLSAIHEGDADDKDLADAINEANSAIEHLKKYLDKDKPSTT